MRTGTDLELGLLDAGYSILDPAEAEDFIERAELALTEPPRLLRQRRISFGLWLLFYLLYGPKSEDAWLFLPVMLAVFVWATRLMGIWSGVKIRPGKPKGATGWETRTQPRIRSLVRESRRLAETLERLVGFGEFVQLTLLDDGELAYYGLAVTNGSEPRIYLGMWDREDQPVGLPRISHATIQAGLETRLMLTIPGIGSLSTAEAADFKAAAIAATKARLSRRSLVALYVLSLAITAPLALPAYAFANSSLWWWGLRVLAGVVMWWYLRTTAQANSPVTWWTDLWLSDTWAPSWARDGIWYIRDHWGNEAGIMAGGVKVGEWLKRPTMYGVYRNDSRVAVAAWDAREQRYIPPAATSGSDAEDPGQGDDFAVTPAD